MILHSQRHAIVEISHHAGKLSVTQMRVGVTAEYPATLTALLKNHGYSVHSVWGNNLKCSEGCLRGWLRGTRYAVRGEKLIQD